MKLNNLSDLDDELFNEMAQSFDRFRIRHHFHIEPSII